MSFLRSKGTTFTNKPIGVVTTRTGSEELYASIARDATRVTNDLLVRAKDEQIKKSNRMSITELELHLGGGSLPRHHYMSLFSLENKRPSRSPQKIWFSGIQDKV